MKSKINESSIGNIKRENSPTTGCFPTLHPFRVTGLIIIAQLLFFPVWAVDLEQPIQSDSADPVFQIISASLSPDKEQFYRKLFKELGGVDFDARVQALKQLIAKGPAILGLAKEFEKDLDPEIAASARTLYGHILYDFDGYLPADVSLKIALNQPATKINPAVDDQPVTLQSIAAEVGVNLVFDPKIVAAKELRIDFPHPSGKSVRQSLEFYTGLNGLAGIPRGKFYLITSPETAERLKPQRHSFDWSALELGHAEAERVGKALQGFFPADTEIHTASETFLVRGEEESISRAARLIALLKPGSPDALWPAPSASSAVSIPELTEKLSAPATLLLHAADPLDALPQLQEQKIPVLAVVGNALNGDVFDAAPFPKELHGTAPLSLVLRDLPAGLILRWMERRVRFAAADQADMHLGYEIGSNGRIQMRMRPKLNHVDDNYVCGANVTFLYPQNSVPSIIADSAVRTILLSVLDSHLALFPSFSPERNLTVLRGRMLMQGPYATLARALDIVREWRASGQAPATASWRVTLDQRLATELDWNGVGVSSRRMIAALREAGQVNLLLEDSTSGEAPVFKLKKQDAQLLPPGRHTLKALLDALVEKVDAHWQIELGAIVLIPNDKLKKDAGSGF